MFGFSAGRMLGTAGGTVAFHVLPEAAVPKGPPGVERDEGWISIDVYERLLVVETSGKR